MFAVEKLIELVTVSWRQLIGWYILQQYETGVVMRLGRCHRVAIHGIHLKLPLVESILRAESVTQPKDQECQTCTTYDGVTVCFQTVIFFSVLDPKAFLVDNDETSELLSSLVMTTATDIVVSNSFEFFVSPRFRRVLKTRVCRQQHRFGVKVERIGLTEQFRFDRTFLTKG